MSNSKSTTTEVSSTDVQPTIASDAAIVDWLAFTVPCDTHENQIAFVEFWVDFLGGGTPNDKGLHGYTQAHSVLGSGWVLWRPDRLDMGVHVVLPSKALALLPDGLEVNTLLEIVVSSGGKVSRLDVAVDSDKVTFETITKAVFEAEQLVSRSQTVKRDVLYQRDKSTPGKRSGSKWIPVGETIYIGSRQSGKMARLYNKAAEQGLGADVVWTRCEVEHKGRMAHGAALFLLEGGSIQELIVSTVDFRCGADQNVGRRERVDWWASWVGSVKRVSFALRKPEALIEDVVEWVRAQVAPSLALLMMAASNHEGWLFRLIDEGFERLPAWRREKAKQYIQNGGTQWLGCPA